ncbi:MAG: hypothetical protein AB1416_04625 [Actinomycetota bacterium]
MRHTRALAALATVAALTAAPAASAKAPPAGKYDCTISGSTLFGRLVIVDGRRYTHRGTRGTYRTSAKRISRKNALGQVERFWRISFQGGSLRGVSGRWYPTPTSTSVTHEIALKDPTDGFERIYCDRWKSQN